MPESNPMTAPRDPRKKPKKGDVLRETPEDGYEVSVMGTPNGCVVFSMRVGGMEIGIKRITLFEWQMEMKDMVVIHAAE